MEKERLVRILGGAFVICSLFLLLTSSVGALSYTGIGGHPKTSDPDVKNSESWFIYNLDPGQAKEDILVVNNSTENDETVLVYPADTVRSSDGGFALKQRVEEMKAMGVWIKLYDPVVPTTTAELTEVVYDQTEEPGIIQRCSILKTIEEDYDGIEDYLDELDSEDSDGLLTYLQALTEWCAGNSQLEIDLPSQSQLDVPFVISIPEEIDVGEHAGALMIEKVAKEDLANGGTGISLTTRVGVRVYETVPGEAVTDINITDFKSRYDITKDLYVLSLSIENKGNISKSLDLRVTFDNKLSGKQEDIIERTAQVQREDTLVSNFEWQKPHYGLFDVQAEVTYDDDGRQIVLESNSISIIVIPWLEVIITLFILALIIVILIYRWYVRNRLAKRKGWKKFKVKKDTSLVKLGRTVGISWRKLARANKIKRPYFVEAGDTILVPSLAKLGKEVKKKTTRKRKKK